MEQSNQQQITENPPLTLKEAEERLRALLAEYEANAWEIGDLLNRVEREGLARREGYGMTRSWLEKALPETQGMTTVLYRYAHVAAVYSKQQVHKWRVSKLELLMAHDREVHGQYLREDPVDREVQLLQPDGSTVVKKFHDCKYREMQQSLRQRRTSSQAPSAKVKKPSPAGSPSASPKQPPAVEHLEKHSLRAGLAMVGAGAVLLAICEFLPQSVFSGWLALGALALTFLGIGVCFRHAKAFTEQLHAAFKEGKALGFLKERMVRFSHGAEKLATTIRSNLGKAKQTPPPEETPIEKKAA